MNENLNYCIFSFYLTTTFIHDNNDGGQLPIVKF